MSKQKMPANANKNVALVLSSGGARGLAHIGVIDALEEEGYHINSIAGCSMGALVGGIYAAGKLEVYKEWIRKLNRRDVFKLVDFTLSTNGFIRGDRVFREVINMIEDCLIEDLPIPFSAVATDIHTRQEVVFTQGSLFDAIRASAAIPTVLTPFLLNDNAYVDGGLMNPIPIKHVKRTPGDLLIVVNVNAHVPYEAPKPSIKLKEVDHIKPMPAKVDQFIQKWRKLMPEDKAIPKRKLGFFELMNASFDLMQDQLSEMILDTYQPDMVINISREASGTFEFYKAEEIIRSGKQAYYNAIQPSNKTSK